MLWQAEGPQPLRAALQGGLDSIVWVQHFYFEDKGGLGYNKFSRCIRTVQTADVQLGFLHPNPDNDGCFQLYFDNISLTSWPRGNEMIILNIKITKDNTSNPVDW